MSLDGLQRLHALNVGGDYELINGSLQMVTGDLTVAEGRRLAVQGALSSPRGIIMQGPGTLTVETIESSDLLVAGGTVAGPLVVTGSVANRGEMKPGGEGSVQQVTGSYTQTASGVLRLSLEADGTNDQLIVDDVAIYRGLLALETDGVDLDPVGPGEFTRWTLVTHGRRNGSFFWVDYNGERLTFDHSSANADWLHVGDGLFRRLEYTPDGVRWVNYRAVVGDVNGDGAFDSVDLVAVFTEGGYENGITEDAEWTTGDWTGDHDFDSSDLVAAFIAGQFEQPSVLGAMPTRAVPEPSVAVLLWLGAVGHLLIVRRTSGSQPRSRV